MYDCIHAYIEIEHNSVHILSAENQFYLKKEIDKEGMVKEFYRIKNISVTKYGHRYYVKGSFATFLYGNNIKTLDRFELLEAIEIFEKITGISIKSAIVTQLEISVTLKVSQSPRSYFPFLASRKGKIRNENRYSLYFTNSMSKIRVYDKAREMVAKKVVDKEEYLGRLLRFELVCLNPYLRYLNKKHFQSTHFTLEDLTLTRFCYHFICIWENEYNRIQKKTLPRFNLSSLSKPSEIISQMAIVGVEAIGGLDAFNHAVDLHRSSTIKKKRPEFYSRIKRKVRDINTMDFIQEAREITELNALIKQQADSARFANS